MARMNRTTSRRALLLALLFLSQASCEPAATGYYEVTPAAPATTSIEAPGHVLFIGNSFTYYNDGVDRHFANLAASSRPPLDVFVDSQTTPAQNLKGHFEDERTRQALAGHGWDVVVLQGSSFEPVYPSTQEEFLTYADRLDSEVRRLGAKTVFFMTWAYRGEPEMTAALLNTYVGKANELGALVVPVGLAWERAQQQNPSMSLYSDSKHSNLNGTYLAACVFYAALFGVSPEGLPYTGGLDAGAAAFLQRVAWETTQTFYDRR